MSVDVVTFGCRLNSVESAAMRGHADAAGLGGAVVVNTCAVTAEAVAQARQAIRRLRRERPAARLVVTGCAAQVDPRMFAAMPEVDRVLGNSEKLDPAAWSALATTRAATDVARTPPAMSAIAAAERQTRAFVAVQNGCDHRCTFCVIPHGRGRSRSAPLGEVIAEVRRAVDDGHREVVLTGVDITDYRPSLGALVKAILKAVPELPRLRLSSLDSAEVDRDLFDAIADEPRLMPHLHLSLQSGDDLILKRMKRRHTRAEAVAFCAEVRRLRPDIVFGADLIAGFPTETEAMFRRSLDLIEDCGLTQLHVFPFSARPDTPASRMPPIPGEVIRERAARLRSAGAAALRRHLDGEIGRRRRVLAERGGLARTEQFTPVRLKAPVEPGVFLDIEVAGHDGRQLLAA